MDEIVQPKFPFMSDNSAISLLRGFDALALDSPRSALRREQPSLSLIIGIGNSLTQTTAGTPSQIDIGDKIIIAGTLHAAAPTQNGTNLTLTLSATQASKEINVICMGYK